MKKDSKKDSKINETFLTLLALGLPLGVLGFLCGLIAALVGAQMSFARWVLIVSGAIGVIGSIASTIMVNKECEGDQRKKLLLFTAVFMTFALVFGLSSFLIYAAQSEIYISDWLEANIGWSLLVPAILIIVGYVKAFPVYRKERQEKKKAQRA